MEPTLGPPNGGKDAPSTRGEANAAAEETRPSEMAVALAELGRVLDARVGVPVRRVLDRVERALTRTASRGE